MEKGIGRLVIVRHGESEWNKKNLFTGWRDVKLTALGEQEARAAGKLVAQKNIPFDLAFTSLLGRAIKTLWLMLEEIPVLEALQVAPLFVVL